MATKQESKLRKDLVLSYLQKYGRELSKRTIAKMLYEDRPDSFKSVEDARVKVRYFTGNHGKHSRHNENYEKFFSAYPEPGLEPMYFKFPMEKANTLLLGDAHIPFHDKRALDAAINYGLQKDVDSIILNGDMFDHYHESRHEKDYSKRDIEHDYHQYLDFLFELRCAFKRQYIIKKIGNHEHRYWKWFMRQGMGKILDVPMFQYEKVMGLDEHRIQVVQQHQTIMYGLLNVIHGHEYKGSGGVNPARWLSLRTGESTLCHHFHKCSEHSETTHRGDTRTWWSVGHLSDPHPAYLPYNSWQQGFARIRKDGDYFRVKNKRIHDGRVL